MLLNIIFRCQEILVYFRSCDLKKLTRFLTTSLSAKYFIKNLDFYMWCFFVYL